MEAEKTEYEVDYYIDGIAHHYRIEGIRAGRSASDCLLEEDEDLTQGFPWSNAGFTTYPLPSEKFGNQLKEAAARVLADAVAKVTGRHIPFSPEQYHRRVSNEEHYAVIDHLRDMPFAADRYMPLKEVDDAVSELLGMRLSCHTPHLQPPLPRFSCSLRIIRPQQPDHNPLHKDAWLDWLRHGINVYIPVAGSNLHTSLPLIPGSHRWREEDLMRTQSVVKMNGIRFNVPSVIKSIHGLNAVRPPLLDREVLVFSPYLLHGGAYNSTADTTRISIEMRFWKT